MGAEAERWAARTDAELGSRGPGELEVVVALADTRATIAALRLYEVDRELRRVAAIARGQGRGGRLVLREGSLPRPISPRKGGLVIEKMERKPIDN